MEDSIEEAKIDKIMGMLQQVIANMDVKFKSMDAKFEKIGAQFSKISSSLHSKTTQTHPTNSMRLEANEGSDQAFHTQTARLEFSCLDKADSSSCIFILDDQSHMLQGEKPKWAEFVSQEKVQKCNPNNSSTFLL